MHAINHIISTQSWIKRFNYIITNFEIGYDYTNNYYMCQ